MPPAETNGKSGAQATAPPHKNGHENAVLRGASKEGCALLRQLGITRAEGPGTASQEPAQPPQFLHTAAALLFLRTYKLGAGVGVQRGSGFVIARLPPSHPSGKTWSNPCFVQLRGVEVGFVWGVGQVATLVGLMNPAAYQQLLSSQQFAFGAEWSVSVWPFGRGSGSWGRSFNADIAVTRASRGLMLDVALEGVVCSVDHACNAQCYSGGSSSSSSSPAEATPEQILAGDVPPAPEMDPLADALRDASCRALAACFEESWHNGEGGRD